MRLLFFLLVLANLLFFAWAQGYLGAADEGHEPQRLAQQLHAEKLRIVTQRQAPAAKPVAFDCRLVNGLNVNDAGTLKAAVEAAGGEAKLLPLAAPPLHLIVITDLPNQAAAEKKAVELTRRGVTEHNIVVLDGGRHEIVLGRFAAEAEARELLQGLTKRGIKSARLEVRETPVQKAAVETRAPAAALPPLIAVYAGVTLGECASRTP